MFGWSKETNMDGSLEVYLIHFLNITSERDYKNKDKISKD